MARKPDILIFNPDQFRADALAHLGCEGSVTPCLDQTAKTDGVSFSNAYCQNPVCTPSRCSFMTGWYPHVHGHRTMHYMLHPDEPMLLRTLKENGYFVWWGGKNDVIPGQFGYEAFCVSTTNPGARSQGMGCTGIPSGADIRMVTIIIRSSLAKWHRGRAKTPMSTTTGRKYWTRSIL
jgi:arylsulfatase A-like enzyme